MYVVQQLLSASALQEVMGIPAWKSLPSWYLVAADDEAIPPEVERQFAARLVSHPQDVLALVQAAARAVRP